MQTGKGLRGREFKNGCGGDGKLILQRVDENEDDRIHPDDAERGEQNGQRDVRDAAGAGNSTVMILFSHYCCTSLRRVK